MIYENVELKKYYAVNGGKLTVMCAENPMDRPQKNWCRPAVIVVPGGAYAFCSKREQEVVALDFLSKGFNCFVLEYSCGENVKYPDQLLELACSIDYVKSNATTFSINPKEVFAVGFSAGGHLVGSLSTDYTIAKELYCGSIDPKLTACGLIYPVITDLCGHTDSFDYLFRCCDTEYRKKHTKNTRLDQIVCKNTAPAFIFSTCMDKTVPSQNALKYAEALADKGIAYELHIYKNGGHGMSVANAEINETVKGISRNKAWMEDCTQFFRDFVKEPF